MRYLFFILSILIVPQLYGQGNEVYSNEEEESGHSIELNERNMNTNSNSEGFNFNNGTTIEVVQEKNELLKEVESDSVLLEERKIYKTKKKALKSRQKSFSKSTSVQSPVPASQSQELEDVKLQDSYSYGLMNASDNQVLKLNEASDKFLGSKKDASIQRTQRSPTVEQQSQMNNTVSFFKENAPESFEYHYYNYVSGNYDLDLKESLFKAEELRPNNSDVQAQMAALNIIVEDTVKAIEYIDKLKGNDRLSEGVLQYSSNLLLSAPDNGVLVTHGFEDTYGTYYAQNKEDVRKDVRLISLDFLQSEEYQNELKEDGFILPESELVNVDYLKDFCEKNIDKSISLSLTTPKEYFLGLMDNLYVVGLTFYYAEKGFNNFFRNDYLWNEKLEQDVVLSPKDDRSKSLSSNYLPMLLHLRKGYYEHDRIEDYKKIDKATNRVGVQCGKYEKVKKIKSKSSYE